MELTSQMKEGLKSFITVSKQDPKAEVEMKVLPKNIQTEDVANRILSTIMSLSTGHVTEENRMTFTYSDFTRVNVVTPQNIQKVIVSNSFREVPLTVEKKNRYYDGNKDIIDIPEYSCRATLRSETLLRKDWDGNPNDMKVHTRLLSRKSFTTVDDLFRIDFSMVKTRGVNTRKTLKDILKSQHDYELEIEFIKKNTTLTAEQVSDELVKLVSKILSAYYRSDFILKLSDIQRYVDEFNLSNMVFFNPVTLDRRHIRKENPFNILKDYTITNKADGERSGLYVSRDRKVLKITPSMQITWTGITASDDSHHGDFIDGEFIADKNLFCIFDVYRFRNRDTQKLPLMKTDDDILKNPLSSRLGCAKLFVEDINKQFKIEPSMNPIRIENKLFLAGDGPAMEEAIRTMFNTKFEYEIDGLIFTPRSSIVAPSEDRRGKTWLRVYKWKPADQNSIDFLVKISNDITMDPVIGESVRKGELYVSKNAGDDIIYPRETMNGEYVSKKLPEDLKKLTETNSRIPSVFQPDVPRDPEAYHILIPLNDKNVPIDEGKNPVKDNTIIECSYDVDTKRWRVMRTRYDKTYQYRALRQPQYGNDIATANSIWSSIHIPITEDTLKNITTSPPDDTYEDDTYYKDNLERSSRVFKEVYNFHNRVKDELYKMNVKKDDVLLELAAGRGGDLHKWKRVQPSKVVALDISLANIISPAQGAAVRYLKDKRDNPRDYLPPVLFLQGDMSVYPLLEQEDKYMPILTGAETASTPYLTQFENLSKFDTTSCQFALHYACESEEVFRNFAKNIDKYCKTTFFGTFLDGQAVYSLLIGKKTHIFGNKRQVSGEFTKLYDDVENWTEKFGMAVKVFLESFDKPAIEYLVPFEKVKDILAEYGFELVESKMFSELYSQQSNVALTEDQQEFSFLNRTFVFTRTSKKKSEPVPEPKNEGEKTVEVEAPKKRKLKKASEPEPEPILFFGADESKGEYRDFSNMSNHPIEINGETFPTVEHYFQAMKAREFKDDEIYQKILTTKTPKAVKAIGKKVKNFVQEVWDAKRDEVMETGVRAKFVQHPELRKKLLETGDKLIGEADPRDTYWGIGTSMDLEKAKFPSKWRGQNKLGKTLMNLRDSLKEQTEA